MLEPGGTFEGAIEIRGNTCNGPVLGCTSMEHPGQLSASNVLFLTQGQPVVIGVDSGAEPGPYTLYVDHAPPCPEQDLGSLVPQTVPATLDGKPHLYEPDPNCIHPGLPQTTFGFTAPATDTYRFRTIGAQFDPILEVRVLDCVGPTLACSGFNPGDAFVDVPLLQGDQVVIIVNGMLWGSGAFSFAVELAP